MGEGRVDKLSTPVLSDENALKIGIFATNLRGGATLADVPGNLQGTWEETLALARRADRMGLDAVIPIARWRGYGGKSNLGDRSFETFTWATGLLAQRAASRSSRRSTCRSAIRCWRPRWAPRPTTCPAGAGG